MKNNNQKTGPLSGLTVIEIEGIGPGPFAGMMLADMGADVIVVERASGKADASTDFGSTDILKRGKRSIAVDLKSDQGRNIVLELVEKADGLIEGMRPGVMERLGLGPDECFTQNPKLIYGRMTGWGQTGPMAQRAGHDLNYIGLSGALWYSGKPGDAPFAPPTLAGDIGGGATYLVIGMLAALLNAKSTGQGQVIDANIVDGSANMMNLILTMVATKTASFERGKSLLDGPHWFDSYKTSDDKAITLGPLEVKFYKIMLEALNLQNDKDFQVQYNPKLWPTQKEKLQAIFITKPQVHWNEVFKGLDACYAPVLNPAEAAEHEHNQARGYYFEKDGILQAAAAPRFSETPTNDKGDIVARGANTNEILKELGMGEAAIARFNADGSVVQSS
ncbi:CaiB/BaiF CoA transferase family protein [Thalassotalea crassostreae]|uniref:CaiB/BaiF CoA transferase family protein n=1 Tax=Thalassotalea crassostreae TaxID=1763536 RepID=UPI000838C596|nr:CaiB/BaiF CoA-transferase family protein [Thalassotalea crassostreae]